MTSDPEGIVWRKSSHSPSNDCVEVGFLPSAALIRDSKNPSGPRLRFKPAAFVRFIEVVKADKLDAEQSE
ncbi:DUF397 domain-containing protein [Allokutzneria sp. A3M-2-11 16]|uniref:DUF397 domain-containing protein n=1 Tax=Allokutzneria sp. A3M-2-11 16 TaxID=2962043 RepID=UPI0020B83519|nr:DUF397 domain-containing protein [Allokutzneria sp. A3M-2-11 16]MCP3800226.1 DUF397 domain-containing protein [Allokutzneria sp. A3M-2-11 16]